MKLSELKQRATIALKPYVKEAPTAREVNCSDRAISALVNLHPTVSRLTVDAKGFTVVCKTENSMSIETLSAEAFAESLYTLLQEKGGL